MTESQVVNEWIRLGEFKQSRRKLIELLEGRFPGLVPAEVTKLIDEQESLELLDAWFDAAIVVPSIQEFMAGLRR